MVGTYNPNSGSISSSACLDADPGYYVPATGQSSQTACVAGTYNPNVGSSDASECINAERGHFVPTSAQSSQTECLAGTYQPYTRQTTCIEADPGYYVSTNAQFSQTACLAGTYNPNQASSSSDACVKANLDILSQLVVNLAKLRVLQEHINQLQASLLVAMRIWVILFKVVPNLAKPHVLLVLINL